MDTHMETIFLNDMQEFLNEQNKINFINYCDNCIKDIEFKITILSKPGNDATYMLEYLHSVLKLLKLDKLAVSVNNNPLLMSEIHTKYQECLSDILVNLEDGVKANDIEEKMYIDCANICKKQYSNFKNMFINDLKTY